MKKTTLKFVALILVIGLLAALAVWLLRMPAPPKNGEEASEDKRFSVRKLTEDISEIYLDNEATSLHFIKENGVWKNVFDETRETYGNTIVAVESILKEPIAEDRIEENAASVEKYGLESPKASLRFYTSDGAEHSLKVGDDIVARSYYFMIDGDPDVYTMEAAEAGLLLSGMSAFVRLDIVNVSVDDMKSVTVKNGDVITLCAKDEDEIRENTVDSVFSYALTSPVQANASPDMTEQMYSAMAQIWAESFDPYADREALGFNEESPYFSVETENGTVKFYAVKKPDGAYYVMPEDKSGVYTVSKDSAAFMELTAFELVDKHISLHYIDEVTDFSVETSAGESYHIVLGDTPTVNGKAVNYEAVQKFYQSLLTLTYDNTVPEGAEIGETEVTVTIGTNDGADVTRYAACDAMSYAVFKDGVSGFTMQKKYMERLLTLAKELVK